MRIPFRGLENNMKLTIRTDKRIQTIKQLVDNTNLFSCRVVISNYTCAGTGTNHTPFFWCAYERTDCGGTRSNHTRSQTLNTDAYTLYSTLTCRSQLSCGCGQTVFRFRSILSTPRPICCRLPPSWVPRDRNDKTKLKQVWEAMWRRENKWEVKRKRCRTKAARWAESV